MTFHEDCTTEVASDITNRTESAAMKSVLKKALSEGRITCGAFQCAQFLQNTPDNVAMIVLPVSPVQEDVGIQIQHTLIQAFCWENDIKVIKVDTMDKLSKILTNVEEAEDANNNEPNICPTDADFSTVLIQCEELFPACDEQQTTLHPMQKILDTDVDLIIELPE